MAAEASGFNHFAEIAEKLPHAADAICRKTAFDLVAYIQTHFSPGHPSEPGQAPGVVTGAYKSSWQADTDGNASWAAYTGMEYGPFLEDGTTHMAPRPHARPAADAIRPDFIHAFQQLEDVLR